MKNTFHKNERLSSRKLINQLFLKGTSISKFPLRVTAEIVTDKNETITQVMFVVPKKKIKMAHDRNTLRRRIKEAYRLNKNDFYISLSEAGIVLRLAISYTHNKELSYTEIDEVLKAILPQCVNKFKTKASNQIND